MHTVVYSVKLNKIYKMFSLMTLSFVCIKELIYCGYILIYHLISVLF